MVGATGFEPATSCSRSRRATKLRYAPSLSAILPFPRVLPDQLHEHAPGVLRHARLSADLLDDLQTLRGLGPDWHHHAPALGQLLERSEEHTSELQSRENLVCRLLLEKKKKIR